MVVTRYFGGTKLGAGGLVRAYGDAVRQLLATLPRALRVPTVTLRLDVPYALFEPVKLTVGQHQGEGRFAAARGAGCRSRREILIPTSRVVREVGP